MSENNKLEIYKGILHYFLNNTSFSLENIAELIDASTKTVKSVYSSQEFTLSLSAELKLLRLYQAALQWNNNSKIRDVEPRSFKKEVRV